MARLPSGLTLFVPFSAPGDRVRVRIVERRRRFARGEIRELLVAGPGRISAPCPAFGRCGGCQWQHLDYPAQLDAKAAILRDALVRIGGWTLPDSIRLTPSASAYGYRSRARLAAGPDGIGYRRRGSHAVCEVSSCPVLVAPLEEELARLIGSVPGRANPEADAEWELTLGRDGSVRSVLLGPGGRAPLGSTAESIEVRAGRENLRISPGSFVQANLQLHDALHSAVVSAAGEGHTALELYAGAGFFTLAVAENFGELQAVEASPGAVADLRANLLTSGRANVRVIEGDAERILASGALRGPDVILLDPPRQGLGPGAVENLAKLASPRIVYLSCDPATLARDTRGLRERGYRLARVEGFDLFPQTSHVEALAVLVAAEAQG